VGLPLGVFISGVTFAEKFRGDGLDERMEGRIKEGKKGSLEPTSL
jgi:hypothetical protein